MNIRPCCEQDLSSALNIIRCAQEDFRRRGIDQWQDGYPDTKDIQQDISAQYAYMLEEESRPVAYFALCFCEDRFYQSIYDGNWLTAGPYAVIHRLAVLPSMRRKGLGQTLVQFAEKTARQNGIPALRADTHEQNLPTLALLAKNGFTRCGHIFVRQHSKRIAFEKKIG